MSDASLDLKLLKTLDYPRQLWCVMHHPQERFLVAAGYDAIVARWDLRAEQPRALTPLTGHHGWVQRLAFAGQTLLSCDSWGRLIAWNDVLAEASPRWNVAQALTGWIRDLAVSPDQQWVAAAGNDARVKLYEVETGKLHAETGLHPTDVLAVAFHPREAVLVTGDLHGKIRCWDLATQKFTREWEIPSLYKLDRIQECGGVRRLRFDETGQQLFVCGMQEPGGGFAVGPPLGILYDWATGKVVQEFQHGDKNQGFLHDALFHPDGFLIGTSGAMPGTGQLWCWKPGEPAPFYVGKKYVNGRSLSWQAATQQLALASVISTNGNGRPKGKAYADGTAKIQLLEFNKK